jgi:SAM-dependent methyltransferase
MEQIQSFLLQGNHQHNVVLSPAYKSRHNRYDCDCQNTKIVNGWSILKDSNSGDNNEFDDSNAQSQFGTKIYWDDMYSGMGDFSSEEYSWYFGWGEIKSYFTEYAPLPLKKRNTKQQEPKILIPGIGNDSILLDLYNYGYKNITAFDYSESAIERQKDLLSYNNQAMNDIKLQVCDARTLEDEWEQSFDLIFEKGALDAIYLSGDGFINMAVDELTRVIKVGGVFMSVSGVVPEELRRELFPTAKWDWLRDGSLDLKAGCFVWRRK